MCTLSTVHIAHRSQSKQNIFLPKYWEQIFWWFIYLNWYFSAIFLKPEKLMRRMGGAWPNSIIKSFKKICMFGVGCIYNFVYGFPGTLHCGTRGKRKFVILFISTRHLSGTNWSDCLYGMVSKCLNTMLESLTRTSLFVCTMSRPQTNVWKKVSASDQIKPLYSPAS